MSRNQSLELNNLDIEENYYQCFIKKGLIECISCVNFFSEDIILCGDELGYLSIFQVHTLNQIFTEKMFDLTLDKIHGTFGQGVYFLQSLFSSQIKIIQVSLSHTLLSYGSNQNVSIQILQNYKFQERIQFIEKISDNEFTVSFKCGELKFYKFSGQSRDKLFEERSLYAFNNPITHLSRINQEFTVCCTARDIIILNNNKQNVEYSCKNVLNQLTYIFPFNRDTFLIGNTSGEMQLIQYNKIKKALQYVQHYNLPQTNIVTSLSKFGNRSLIYTSDKGTFLYDLINHVTVTLHSRYSLVTALQPDIQCNSSKSRIVIADKNSNLNILSLVKENIVSA